MRKKAVDFAKKNFGQQHPTTAIRYSNLATVLLDLKEFERALELAREALAVFQQVLPEGHPNIGIAAGWL